MSINQELMDAVGEASPLLPRSTRRVPGRNIHIDADILAYQHGGGHGPAHTRDALRRHVRLILEATGCERAILHTTTANCDKGQRYLIAKTRPYQGNRKGHKPKNWVYAVEYILSGDIPDSVSKQWMHCEADDGMAYLATKNKGDLLMSLDKDLRMIPCIQVDWDSLATKNIGRLHYGGTWLDKTWGLKWFHEQLLQGDTVDNIPGIGLYGGKRIGPARAAKHLAGCTTPSAGWSMVIRMYKEQFGEYWADAIAERAMLLWIRRHDPTDNLEFIKSFEDTSVRYSDVLAISQAALEIHDRVQEEQEELNVLTEAAEANSGGTPGVSQ